MSTNFPTSLDALTNPAAGDPLNAPSHSEQHANANDAIEALEAKVGVNGSAVTSSLDYKLTNAASSNPGHVHTVSAITDYTAPPAGANPTGTVGLSAVNGSATTFLRSDGAPALSQAIAPTWTAAHIWQVSSANAVSIGPNGDTNPVLRVVTNVSSAATGISITGNAAGSSVTLTVLSSGTNESLLLVPKGAGTVTFAMWDMIPGLPGYGIIYSGGVAFRFSNAIKAYVKNEGSFYTASGSYIGWSSTVLGDGTPDTGFSRLAAGVSKTTDGSTGTGWLQQSAGRSRLTANATNATVTPANLTDLSLTLKAGRKYTGILRIRCSTDVAADGILFDFDGGTATMTSFAAGVVANVQGATAGVTVSTALGTDLTFTALSGTGDNWIDIAVTMVVNAAGTFIPRFAQNAHTTGTATVGAGSYLWLEDMPA